METSPVKRVVEWIGLLAGPGLALVVFMLLPVSYENAAGDTVAFTAAGRATLAAMTWMGIWWLTEAIDISATALLPLAVFPILGIASIDEAAAPYANDLIFLFMGGFLLALSMQRWNLDRRIALLTLRIVGTRPVFMIAGFMACTAVLSAFVSNTATAAMMLPIAISVVDLLRRQPSEDDAAGKSNSSIEDSNAPPATPTLSSTSNFALCLMLGIAYAASIGGIATIIGTPPNGFLVKYLEAEIAEPYRVEISFVRWMMIGVPLSIVFLPIVWLLLTRVLYPIRIKSIPGGRALINEQYRALGPPRTGEWITFIVFLCTALLWMTRPLLEAITIGSGDDAWHPFAGLSDAGIAMIAGLALFVIPVNLKSRTFTMNWDTAKRLPWGILILFGGGLSLAAAVQANGVAEFIGAIVAGFGTLPAIVLVVVVATIVIFLTELTSNTATTATLVPILAPLAVGLGLHPYLLVFPAAIAASCAFMMPVATPPNAIVFGSGWVTIPQMCKAGMWLNLLGIILVTLLTYAIIVPFVIP